MGLQYSIMWLPWEYELPAVSMLPWQFSRKLYDVWVITKAAMKLPWRHGSRFRGRYEISFRGRYEISCRYILLESVMWE